MTSALGRQQTLSQMVELILPNRCIGYTAALLHESFSDLEILHLKEYDALIEEGQGHSGMSALVDLVARKPLA